MKQLTIPYTQISQVVVLFETYSAEPDTHLHLIRQLTGKPDECEEALYSEFRSLQMSAGALALHLTIELQPQNHKRKRIHA